ncbi:zinc ribbon domain-containing protein [Candidatus Omnitrophota bacterium]
MGEYICPNCGKPVYDDEALLCLYCGENLRRGVGFMGRIKYPRARVIIFSAVTLLLLALLIFLAV